MQIPSSLMNTMILAATIGGVVAINIIIAGLIIIAVVHDGTTATDVSTSFQQILQTAITALGMLLSGLITGKIVITHMMTLAETQAGTTPKTGGP